MLLQTQIAEVADTQSENFLRKNLGWERELLHNLEVLNNFALIVTGVRRCGKSTLLFQLLNEKFDRAFYLNFEDSRLAGFENDDFKRLNIEITKRKPQVLFFDEIQMLKNWELFVRQKLDEGYKVAITGSNATLLSTELGTKLTGRHLSVELFPFSYTEFLGLKKLKNTDKSVIEYLKRGGFPEYLKTGNGFVLNQLLEDILYRDIAIRYGVRDVKSLKQLTVYLLSNIGKPVSATNLKTLFGIKSVSALLDYFYYLESAYLVQFLPMFSYSLKKQENTVYLHLRRKYKELYYFQEKKECDFVVFEKGKPKELIQACYELTPENVERETNGLYTAMEHFKMTTGKIVTLNLKDSFTKAGKKIEVVALKEFLSQS
jgi:predicted AAA+ superfamily ATPase